MSAIVGVILLAVAAAMFLAMRLYFPDRGDESDMGELSAQLACVAITGCIGGGLAGLVDFAANHDNAQGVGLLGLAVAAALAIFVFAGRIGRRASAA